ncbi:Na+/H+ antiporter subunit G [Desulfosarcina alkanivorans]|jgi:multicomponent Na+:H+ antiporter subunit G|uniref:Na+/H+ antiporter subunit G n=1 Tax=Desulfosarcina alkanivorans TaxID=571177 RepID=A0A5K7YX02_9BACT|nr:monovalent cation/H(+) antiporter subunit G [Desulfosarcina alkanivorans]BBO69217.1 Na+/H+ antiporter subunit G [Desulfosarcina alkanivorans]
MSAVIASALLIIGSIFCLVAAVGMLRLPDTLIRMHAATKAGTLGAGFILAAEAVVAAELGTTLKAIAAIVFLLLTAPVAAHLIGRAAYHQGIHLFEKTWIDELGERLPGEPTAEKPPSDASDTSAAGDE